jgi:nitroreductase
MQLKEAIETRKSVKRYMDKKPDWRKVIRALDAARFAPAAGNQFIMKFILVQDEKKIAEIATACQQEFVGTAKCLVVFVSDENKLDKLYGERGKRYASQQAGAAIENFLLALNAEGLVTNWVGHFYDDQVKRTLKISSSAVIEAIFPIGIETKIKTPAKPKPALENLIYFDEWKNKKMEPLTRVSVESV